MNDSTPQCPLCASQQTTRKHKFHSPPGIQETFAIRECKSCAHLFTSPLPSEELLNRLYNSEGFVRQQADPQFLDARKEYEIENWEMLKRHLSGGVLADVGCGAGSFISFAPEFGYEAIGLEENSELARYARQHYGVKIMETFDIRSLKDTHVDIIALRDVFEHLPHPHDILNTINKILPPGGWLYISLPNARSLEAKWFGSHFIGWWIPLHLNHFSPASIERLLEQHDFEVVEMHLKQIPFSVTESAWRLLGKDTSDVAAFNGWSNTARRWIESTIGRSKRLNFYLGIKLVHLFDRLVSNPERAPQRAYITLLARKKNENAA